MRIFYILLFSAGFFGAVYVYGYHFNDFSETEMVQTSYLWFPAVFGGMFGALADDLRGLVLTGEASSTTEALTKWKSLELPIVYRVLVTPFRPLFFAFIHAFGGRDPRIVAFSAVIMSTGFLILFFEAIFPGL